MKKIILTLGLMLTLVILPTMGQAPQRVQAIKDPIVRELPNGDSLTIYLRGDERHHWTMTLDGWAILEKDNGYFYYQRVNRKGELKVSCRKAHNEDQRSKCERRWLDKHGKNYNNNNN